MAIFEPFKLGTWKDREYVVPADDIMPCIRKVEAVVTLFGLARMRATGDLPAATLSEALAVAMRHAGAEVTDAELYNALFKGADARTMVMRTWVTLHALERLMIPPEHLQEPEKPGVKRSRGGRAASSKARTSSRSGSAG
jgi:hypothetical protein